MASCKLVHTWNIADFCAFILEINILQAIQQTTIFENWIVSVIVIFKQGVHLVTPVKNYNYNVIAYLHKQFILHR